MSKKNLIIGISTLIAAGGLGYIIYKNNQSKKTPIISKNNSSLSQEQIEKNQIEKIKQSLVYNDQDFVDFTKIDKNTAKQIYLLLLKDQYKAFQPFIDELEQLSRFLKQQAIQKGQDPKPEDIRMTLLGNQGIMDKMGELEDKVYKSHKINKEQLSNYVKENLKDYEIANQYLQKTANLITAATSGQNLALLTPVPDELTVEKTFSLTQKCMLVSNVQLQKELMNIKAKKGKIDFEDEETRKILNDINISQQREKIFKEEGIQGYDDPPQRILRAAVTKYMEKYSKQFEAKLQELEGKHQQCYKDILQNPTKIIDFKSIYNIEFKL